MNDDDFSLESLEEKCERDIENQVGISAYCTDNEIKIGGIYKYTYRDFIVREIQKDGKILNIKEDHPSVSFSRESRDEFTSFNLIKINMDTFEALRKIAKKLNIHSSQIQYSGLKDKCAISVQKVSIHGNYVDQLNSLEIRDLYFRNIQPISRPVKLGRHWGNSFAIVIRSIKDAPSLDEIIDEIIHKIHKYGFPNYYGLQRFGSFRPNSHLIGKYILEENYERAFEEFVLKLYPTESMVSQKARKRLAETGDYVKAYNDFPTPLYYERKLIHHLIQNKGDFEGAFKILSPDLKTLLISAFQSYVFNKILSLRATQGYSLFKPYRGDVIGILDDKRGSLTQIKYKYGSIYNKKLVEAIEFDRASILAPIVGYETDLKEYPFMHRFLKILFDIEGLNFSLFESKMLRKFNFVGSIRPIYVKPTGLSLIWIKDDEIFEGRKKIKLEFSLPKGSYATMLIREFIK